MAAETAPARRGWYWIKAVCERQAPWVPRFRTGTTWDSPSEPAVIGPRILDPDEAEYLDFLNENKAEADHQNAKFQREFEHQVRQAVPGKSTETTWGEAINGAATSSGEKAEMNTYQRVRCLELARKAWGDAAGGRDREVIKTAQAYYEFVCGGVYPNTARERHGAKRRDPTAEFNGA